eukprot:gene7015-11180_t
METSDDYLSFDFVAEALNLIPDKIYAIYQFGSRVYESNSKNSDYDLFVVYGEKYLDLVIENQKFNIGAHLNDIKTFKKFMKTHNACIVQVLFLPEKFILFENKEMKTFRKNFMISMKKLERGFLRVESICILKSKREFNTDKKKSLKNLVHGIRFLLFGIQIAKTGKIYDFTVGNKYHKFMMSLEFDNWDEYYKKFEQHYLQFHQEFSDFVFEDKSSVYEKYSKKSTEKLQLIHFLKENNLQLLTKYFSIQLEFLSNGLISFLIDPIFSNMTCLINQECQSTVILNKNFELVGKSFNFETIKENLKLKYMTKRNMEEYLVFYNQNEIQIYPENVKFSKLFHDSKFEKMVQPKKSYTFNIDKNDTINIISIIDNQTVSSEAIPEVFSSKGIYSNCQSMENVKKEMKNYDPIINGYILVDEDFKFYHLEYPIQVFSRKIDYDLGYTDSNVESILEIIRFHVNFDEILKFFENTDVFEMVEIMVKIYIEKCKEVNCEFDKIKHLPTPKDFSAMASKTKIKIELMALYNWNHKNLQEYWEVIPIQKLKSYFKKRMKNIAIKPRKLTTIERF